MCSVFNRNWRLNFSIKASGVQYIFQFKTRAWDIFDPLQSFMDVIYVHTHVFCQVYSVSYEYPYVGIYARDIRGRSTFTVR